MWRLNPRSHRIRSTTKIVQSILFSFAHLSVLKISVPGNSSIYYLVVAGASDFPHSRQDVLDRDVISPQNGHILCEAKPRTGGVSDANSLETDAVILASRLRRRSRNRPKALSISDPPSFFLP